jgi:hypothetical protein
MSIEGVISVYLFLVIFSIKKLRREGWGWEGGVGWIVAVVEWLWCQSVRKIMARVLVVVSSGLVQY